MKLLPPIENFNWSACSQLFGVNRETYEKKFGLPGHNALDMTFSGKPKNGYGERILAAHDGIVEKMIFDVPHSTKGNGVYLLSKDKTFSTIYWHLSDFTCSMGEEIKAGQTIGKAGNSGFVNPAPTKENPWAGVHLHFGILRHDIPNNLYGGFVDPLPYLFTIGDKLPMSFSRDLSFGMEGDDVSWLQSILALEGYAPDYQPIGFFGEKTLRDAKLFQSYYNIIPSMGYIGSKTRAIINTMYT